MVSNIETPWPALTFETLEWHLDPTVPLSRSARRRVQGPYQAAVVPQIADSPVYLDGGTVAAVDDAAAEIARFDAEMGSEIAPFAAVLLRSESAASSNIENLTASARAIAEAELSPYTSGNARRIVANVWAMTAALQLADRIEPEAILRMHEALLEASAPEIAGKWREEQVWIGGNDAGPHGAMFVPPHHRHVRAAIDDLVKFITRDDVAVLAHAALAHAQFETIHPFPGGNGRTGRALLHAQLRNKGLTRNVTVPVSAGLLTDTEGYFEALNAYRGGEPSAIVNCLANASFAAVGNGRQLVADLREVRAGWTEAVRARRGATTWKVADLLLRHPVVNAALIAAELRIAGQNTYRALRPLEEAGVIIESTDKKRNQMWRAPEVLDALDRFAQRAGRRSKVGRR